MVPEYGRITAAAVFRNTILCFGKTKMVLEEDYVNINAHYNSETRKIEIVKSSV
jgi:hypothetical protein